MILQPIHCPHCHGTNLVKNGKTSEGKQRFICRSNICEQRTFILNYSQPGWSRNVKQQIVDMALNGSGIRDTARVLHRASQYSHSGVKKKEHDSPTSELVGVRATKSGAG